jgi:predicted amidohydrolase
MTETTQTETVVRPDTVQVEQQAQTVIDAGSGEGEGEAVATEASTVEVVDGDTSVKVTGDTPVSLVVAAVLGLILVLGLAAKKLLK